MNRRSAVAGGLIALGLGGRGAAQSARLRTLAEGLVGAGAASPRSAVVRIERMSGDAIFEAAAGEARPDTRALMTAQTPFHHASVSKVCTAILILQMAEAGAFGRRGIDARFSELGVLDRDVQARLLRVDGRDVAPDITLRHLLTHTSGMRDAIVDDAERIGGPAPQSLMGGLLGPGRDPGKRWIAWDPRRPEDADAGVLNLYLARGMGLAGLSTPGARFHYSDTAFVLLALLAERMGRAPYHELVRRRISVPLGLSGLYVAYRDDPKALGPARSPEAEVWFGPRPLLSGGFSLSFDWGGGGTVSPARDLTRLWRGLAGGELFRHRSTFDAMTSWIAPPGLAAPRTGVGLGLFRVAYPGGELWGHSGAWGARMWCDPQRKLVLAGTVNQVMADGPWHFPFFAAAADEAKP
ncbi:MAG: class A beta-lactamase-related serine hydrolase [Phenylobacterium sp.]|uniref:serine hydrolase domain-containing protein n=1 Tax=Phenylobacterium sp. TaxID=1871053 RepID=UPI0012075CC7|nr:serine hydrolase domain-containing protein [Phenylobacterium sp.]TAL38564.1 MAG: class A beta-lactamase-related serine hydrolase [Phenylobacterium sp.]